MFTKKHAIALAAMICAAKEKVRHDAVAYTAVYEMQDQIFDLMLKTNPNMDPFRWNAACLPIGHSENE